MEVNYEIISLLSKIEELNANKVSLKVLRETLLQFKCSRNHDEEDFLHNKAIFFELHNKARTYLIMIENEIVGYFSLAFKSIDLSMVSLNQKKQMTAGESDSETYSSYLIGHIAKADGVHNKIGYAMLDNARDLITVAQKYVGGRLIYIDCKDEAKLNEFYEKYGFKYFKTSEQTGLKQYYIKI